MKILQFMASTGYGGAESVFVELSNKLAEKHTVAALLLQGTEYIDRFSDRVEILQLTTNPTTNNPLLHFQIYQQLQKYRPQIIHTHAVKGTVLINRVNILCKLPHLATKHNDRKGKIFNTLPWVSCVSGQGKKSIQSRSGSVRVIYNGVEPVSFTHTDKPPRFSMISIGRLDKIKGFSELIEQVKELPFDYQLTIVGEGPERINLEEQIINNNLQDRIQLIGFSEDIARLIQRSHLVLVASHKEGGPKTAIETLFYGDMLLSTPVGMVPEFLPDRMQMNHTEIGLKIGEVYENYRNFTAEFSKLKKTVQNKFLLTTTVAEYEKYYASILQQAGG